MVTLDKKIKETSLESYFKPFRENIVGINHFFDSPDGRKKILYTDWTASGRLYKPIEEKILNDLGPFVANTHTETSVTGSLMTKAYHKAHSIIKNHVGANKNDVLICEGSGMTGAINKLQRILGFRIHEKWKPAIKIKEQSRPVVFVTHMEHHSNHTSWLETIADVEIINATEDGGIDLNHLQDLCYTYNYRKVKIASVTACSNVTGIETPYHQIAKIMHENNGLCFVDFACSGPYVDINMHPKNTLEHLDAIFLSPHKFLGGPGTTGIVVFGDHLYGNQVPDNPGGGTVVFTSPFGKHYYTSNIEEREDGGTPAFLQTIKAAMAIKLKEEMGVENISNRKHEIMHVLWDRLINIDNLHILQENRPDRHGVISFFVDGLHYNLGVKLLNDKYGIQVRGGCSCAGTYGHYLLNIDQEKSSDLKRQLFAGENFEKPGWIRLSIHPTMTDDEVQYVANAIEELCQNFREWSLDYEYLPKSNDFKHKIFSQNLDLTVDKWL
ncbi:MAG: aminotransferase class V-fold PLP-dependent enzyme [Flavobacteriales bacterium]|nr:aminotransferase class V-fold PLP-dependent enzyme [Flavobacteriales bacterium]